MPRILLTGFEPFGGDDCNPSQEVVSAFTGRRLAGHQVLTEILPVSFERARTALTRAIDRHAPALVLGLGLAGGRTGLSLERVAINLIDARIPDNGGDQPVDVPVIPGAPAAYFTSLPLKAMRDAVRHAGIPAELSLSAGSFVCNAVFFAACHLAAQRAPAARVGFLHQPFLPAQAVAHPGAASLDLPSQRRGVQVALETAIRTFSDLPLAGGTLC